jgi:hypothetical protein
MYLCLVGKNVTEVYVKKKFIVNIVVKKDTIQKYWSDISSAGHFCTTVE